MVALNELEISEKLKNYLEWIENETGRRINFVFENQLGLPGMSFAFSISPSQLVIHAISGINVSDPKHDHSIAHEATHGYLLYKVGYSKPEITGDLTPVEGKSLGLIVTMIDDIVVNKLIEEKGFSPFGQGYFDTVARETRGARRGEDCYTQMSPATLKFRFMVFRYVLAWGFINYFNLTANVRNRLQNFLDAFGRQYPEQTKIANDIIRVISSNDIFTVEGNKEAIKGTLSIWGLDTKVAL